MDVYPSDLPDPEQALIEAEEWDPEPVPIGIWDLAARVCTPREFIMLELVLLQGHTLAEAARIVGVQRQTGHERYLRAIEKMRRVCQLLQIQP